MAVAGVSVAAAAALSAYLFPRGIEVLRGERGLDLADGGALGEFARRPKGAVRLDRVPYSAAFQIPERPAGDASFRWLPGAIARDYYPDDPRDYLEIEPADEARIRLEWCGWARNTSLLRREIVRERGFAFDRVGAAEARRQTPWDVALQRSEKIQFEAGDVLKVSMTARAAAPKRVVPAVIDMATPPPAIGAVQSQMVGPNWRTYRWEFPPAQRAGTVTLTISLAEDVAPLDVRQIKLTLNDRPLPLPYDRDNPPRRSVEYAMNRQGFRDDDFQPQAAPGHWRIAVLGDSFTFGIGVRAEHIYCNALESALNERGGGRRYELLNFGVPGYSTRDERMLYETLAGQYESDVVLVVMVQNDHIPIAEYLQIGGNQDQYDEYTRQHGFQPCVEELRRLHERVDAQGKRLAVVSFCIDDNPQWAQLEEAVFPELAQMSVPHFSLREGLVKRGLFGRAGHVHPKDQHPNDLAHRAAAELLAEFLGREGLLGPN